MVNSRLSYVSGGDKPKLIEKTIPEIQAETTNNYPNKEFLVSVKTGQRLTFKEFDQLTNQVAKGLISLGIQKKDRVGIATGNSVEWIATFFALFKIGAYPVNIVPSLKPQHLTYMINQPGIKCLFADKRNIEIAQNLDLPNLQEMIFIEDEDFDGAAGWSTLLASAKGISDSALHKRRKTLHQDNIAGLCYTSGTTGDPKGAMLTHRALVNNCNFLSYLFNYDESDVMPLTVPMFHFFGWILSIITMLRGMKLVLPTSYVRPDSILECLEEERCTTMGSAPQIYNFFVNLTDLETYDLTDLKHCFCGSDVLSGDLIDSMFNQLKLDTLQNVWGSTELGGGFTITPPGAPPSKITPIGKIIPHSELKIVDPMTEKTLPPGEGGEIWGRGPSTFKGYWKKDEETRQTLTEDGWVRTGDVGFMDKEGFVHFIGRLDEMFKKGARKVAPAPIENVLRQHPEIVDAGVVGVPDERYGLEVAAFVQLKEETLQQLEKSRKKAGDLKTEMQKLARKNLESFKVPKYVKFVKELPRTATGKIRHFILKEKAKELANSW